MTLSTTVISDRRGQQRHAFHADATVVLADGRQQLVQTLDIGKGGAAIVADFNPAAGSTLMFRVRLPARGKGSVPFESVAQVVSSILAGHEGGFRVGLQFPPLNEASLAALKGLLP